MLNRTYPNQDCSVARTLEVVGERWSLLILRDAFFGVRRFDEFQERLGIARNVLAARLAHLCDSGLLERRPYSERPQRFEYHLTAAGRDLGPVLLALIKWGDRHHPSPQGPPVRTLHRGCGGEVDALMHCQACGAHVEYAELELVRRETGLSLDVAPAR
jgi:DNA-binding HxlR family transcriptional regulator